MLLKVSIPQSEFCPLGRGCVDYLLRSLVVSIPQSEFCPLGLYMSCYCLSCLSSFQFLSRNSVRWDLAARRCRPRRFRSFNSSVGILSVGTLDEALA